MIRLDHPVRGQRGRVLFVRDRAPSAEEVRRLVATRQKARRTTWSHVHEVDIVLLEGNAPERALLVWRIEGPDTTGADPTALADLVTSILRALPGTRVQVDDPLALFSRHGARFVAEPDRGSRPDALPAGWSPRPGTLRHAGRGPRARTPPANRGQLVDLLGVLDACTIERDELIALAVGPVMDPRFEFRSLVARGVLAAAGLRALQTLVEARIIPPTGLPELAHTRLADGDDAERMAARALLVTLGETPPVESTTLRPRLATVGDTVRSAWAGLGTQRRSTRGTDGSDDIDLEMPLAPLTGEASAGSRAWRALAAALPPPLPAHSDWPWPTRPSLADLPVLSRSERLEQVLSAGPSARRTGALALLAVGGPAETDTLPPGSFDALVEILDTRAPDQSLDASLAALALGRMPAPEATRRLTRHALESPDADVSGAAAEALAGHAGPLAREGLRDALTRPRSAAVAAEAAARIGDIGALPGILALAESTSHSLRTAAARALARVGSGDDVRATLERLASDAVPAVARAARSSLAVHLPTELLAVWLAEAPPSEAAAALVTIGHRDRLDAWTVVVNALQHRTAEVRAAATATLGWFGAPGATPLLVERLADTDLQVVLAACLALARCGDQRAVAPLRTMARSTNEAGLAARRALVAGRHFRSPPPDNHVRLRALPTSPINLESAGRLASAIQSTGIRCRVSAAGVQGEATVSPDDIPGLFQVARALDAAVAVAPELRWSVRDGQHLLRRHGRRWIVSRHRGRVARNAGWFDETITATGARPPLTPAETDEDILEELRLEADETAPPVAHLGRSSRLRRAVSETPLPIAARPLRDDSDDLDLDDDILDGEDLDIEPATTP